MSRWTDSKPAANVTYELKAAYDVIERLKRDGALAREESAMLRTERDAAEARATEAEQSRMRIIRDYAIESDHCETDVVRAIVVRLDASPRLTEFVRAALEMQTKPATPVGRINRGVRYVYQGSDEEARELNALDSARDRLETEKQGMHVMLDKCVEEREAALEAKAKAERERDAARALAETLQQANATEREYGAKEAEFRAHKSADELSVELIAQADRAGWERCRALLDPATRPSGEGWPPYEPADPEPGEEKPA